MSAGGELTDRQWLQERFDRIDDKVGNVRDELAEEIKETRHGTKELIGTLTLQVAELVTVSRGHERELGAINEWRTEGGPLDSRFRRHDARLVTGETWRNRFAGAVGIIAFLFPTTIGVLVAMLR